MPHGSSDVLGGSRELQYSGFSQFLSNEARTALSKGRNVDIDRFAEP